MPKRITKAIIPAAGLGTRFLPQTKAMPKEMLPIIDKPVIQLVVEELVEAGVTDIIIVTGPQKRAIEDHFDRSIDLEQALIEKGKLREANQIRRVAEMANFIYVRQKGEPKGNARPVLNAAHLLGDEPFLMLFPDDFFHGGETGCAMQMVETFNKFGGNQPVLSLVKIKDKTQISKYGVASVGKKMADGVWRINDVIEKPKPNEAPSNLASVHGYILTSDVVKQISNLKPKDHQEIAVVDALKLYIDAGGQPLGKLIDGHWLDCGSPEGYLNAVMHVAKNK